MAAGIQAAGIQGVADQVGAIPGVGFRAADGQVDDSQGAAALPVDWEVFPVGRQVDWEVFPVGPPHFPAGWEAFQAVFPVRAEWMGDSAGSHLLRRPLVESQEES